MVDVIIFGGQSNMQGQTEARPSDRPVTDAYEYLTISDSLEPLAHPVGESVGYDAAHFSHVLLAQSYKKRGNLVPDFCRSYLRTQKRLSPDEEHRAAAIHTALGSTVIADWLKGTARYDALVEKARRGIEKARTLGAIGKIRFVWLQGESDALAHTATAEYLDRLYALKNALKEDLGIDAFGIIRVGYFCCLAPWRSSEEYEARRACDDAVMKAQELAVKRDGDFVMLTRITASLSLDKRWINPEAAGHFNNAAMKRIGSRAGARLAAWKR